MNHDDHAQRRSPHRDEGARRTLREVLHPQTSDDQEVGQLRTWMGWEGRRVGDGD